jgi:hypothetical protein
MSLCLIQNPGVEWDDIVDWFCKMEGCSLQVLICKLCLAAVVYHLSCLRNDLCHGNTPRTEEALVARIQWEVRSRIMFRRFTEQSDMASRLKRLWKS